MISLNLFSGLLDWYMDNMSYLSIAILMAIESTFIPLPSELVLPPAAWKAAQIQMGLATGNLNLFLIILYASIGCVVGAAINYVLSRTLGRTIIYGLADSKAAKIFFINREKLQKAENYFIENGNTSTFIGRLIPGVRHLISIPAGLAKMNFYKFVLYTFSGSFVWNTILSLLGYYFGKNQDLLMKHFHELQWVALAAGILFLLYLIVHRRAKKRKK
jgi:membrane protein DedA with SNARE-associated domain